MKRYLLMFVLAGCSAKTDGPKVEVASPSAGAALPLDPGLVCNEQLTTTVTVHGSGMSPMPIDIANDPRVLLPTIVLTRGTTVTGGATDPATATWSGEVGGTNGTLLAWRDQETMSLVIDGATGLAPGIYDAQITNPNGHGATSTGAIAIVPRPTLDDLTPGITCLAQGARTITLAGTGLLTNDGVGPELFIGDMQDGATITTTGCEDIAHAGLDATTCSGGTAELAQDLVDPGLHVVTITNPDPAACISTEVVRLRVAPAPVVSSLEPSLLCVDDPNRNVVVHGTGFLKIDGAMPTVTVGAMTTSVTAMRECTPLETDGYVVESCNTLDLTLTVADLVIGQADVVVTNPDPAGCNGSAAAALTVVGSPDVTGVIPTAFCQATGGDLVVTGTGFAESARVSLEDAGEHVADAATTYTSSTELQASFAFGLPVGPHDLVVDNGGGCRDVLPLAVEVEPTPLVLFVDPPVVYSGITIDATIYVTGLSNDDVDVVLVANDGTRVTLEAQASSANNKIQATIPAGLADGEWAVEVTSDVGCVGTLAEGISVTSELAIDISAVDPAFAWTGQTTAITLTSASGDFMATPRAYLNPKGAPDGTVATAVRAVLFDNANTVTGVVPRGLVADQAYELIVVNPDGRVGVFDALTVTADPPPVVTGIVPASLDGNEPQVATIEGSAFLDGITASMVCRDPSGLEHGPLTVVPVDASVTATSFDATFPVDQVPTGSVCVVTVTNPDGAAFRYSALSTKTPAQNLNPWRTATPLVEARRGLGLVAQRPTNASRFVYALGGDDGTVAGAKASIEVASVGLFGDMNAWTALPQGLPAPRTLAGAVRVGRFVYMIGGNDGNAPVASVVRALVLDPLAAPEIVDVGVAIDEDEPVFGIGAGTWVYRVAATFPADDLSNPGGESLPGEPFVVTLPDVAGLVLTLRWDAIPNASGYVVYRTRDGDPSSEIERIATTVSNAFSDTGASTTIGARPLPSGSLGAWHAVAALTTPREAPAVAVAPDPDTPDRFYLYAFGGRDAAPLSSWEVASIDVSLPLAAKSSEQQAFGTWTAGAGTLGVARAEASAVTVSPSDVEVPDGHWIYVGSGRGTNGAIDALDAAQVTADGTLTLVRPAKKPPAGAGYGFGVANGFLFVFGGAGGAPSTSGVSGELCVGVGTGGCNPDELPEVRNWNSLGIALATARYLAGTTQESAFFFVAGGMSAGGVTTSVETTVQ